MSLRSILVPICPSVSFQPQLDAALSTARHLEAHINALFIRPDPAQIYASLPNVAITGGVTLAKIEREGADAAASARAEFEAWRERNNLACSPEDGFLRATYACWKERMGVPEMILARRGRLNDLIVLNFPATTPSTTERLFDTALFATARPVLLVPTRLPDTLLRHVVIAWNGSLEATRAIAGAMPLLHAAERVSVFSAPWQGDGAFGDDNVMDDLDLPGALVWHGIRAHARTVWPRGEGEGEAIGAALLREAVALEATLLVMGGFTRSRVPGFLLGGVTRHVLENPAIPVLMAH